MVVVTVVVVVMVDDVLRPLLVISLTVSGAFVAPASGSCRGRKGSSRGKEG